MDDSFAVVAIAFLLGVLWLPSLWVALTLKRRSVPRPFKRLRITWLFQALVAPSRMYLADRIGLLKPAGVVPAITTLVSVLGASILWGLRRPSQTMP